MITLNSERGVRLVAPRDDIIETPGFTVDVDAKIAKLKEIIGGYTFGKMIPRVLSICK